MIKHIAIAAGVVSIVVYVGVAVLHNQQAKPPQGVQGTNAAPVVSLEHPQPAKLFTEVNEERVKAGLQPLVEDPRLDASAAAKCDDMVRLNEWAHDLSDGTTPFTFIQQQFDHYSGAAENLAYNPSYQFDSQDTVNSWMKSPSHRAAILNSLYTNVGYAICSPADYPDTVVQHFEGE